MALSNCKKEIIYSRVENLLLFSGYAMDDVIGIDKENILQFSEKIREAWNDFFWEFRVCQHHIRFTDEERSNYLGDLLNYFDDTIHHLEKFKTQPDYHSSLYEAVAVLQMMYVQQDLLDELLNLFKLDKSMSEEKKFIRQLRNELIGHPISRDRGKLVSSVFITGSTKGSILSYIRYHRDDNYKHDLISHNWKDIYSNHEKYLEYYLSKILHKITEILSHFSTVILKLKKGAGSVSFEKLVNWINKEFEIYTKNYPLFYPDNILLCYQKRDDHPRYRHALGLFQDGLGERISGVQNEIERITCPPKKTEVNSVIDFKISFVSYVDDVPINQLEEKKKINYEFSKLNERDHIFGLGYFSRVYENDPEIIHELQNMSGPERDVEFHCSYAYLKYIFRRRGLL